ncbi:neprilysin-1-like [Dermacentor variabilis]|uniref:neprilysin-1-like n=1 Tax=Dermacentor variabilis TaxID=34621 RepID=UPI003F5C30C0
MAQELSGGTDDSTVSETEAEFVTADYTELCLVLLGLLCVVALVATLAWYLLFYVPVDEGSGRKSANFTRLLELSLTRTVQPCENFYRFVCGGWNRDHAHGHLSVADKVAEETMLHAQDALKNAAVKARETKSPARNLVIRSVGLDATPSSQNESGTFDIPSKQSRLQRAHAFLMARSRRPSSALMQETGHSAVLKAAAMFESCTKVVAEKTSEREKLAEFMNLYTEFPNVQPQDADSLVATMVELSLTWKIHIMFVVDLFIDHDEDEGRLTVDIGRNDELFSWLQKRNILKDSGKLGEFFLTQLQALPGFQPSEAEATSTKITDVDSRIIAALRTDDEPAQAIKYDELPSLVPDVDPQVWVDVINKQIQPYSRIERDHHVKVGNARALREVGRVLMHADEDPLLLPMFLGWTMLRQLAPRASYKAATFVFKDKQSYVHDCFRRVVDVMPLAAGYPLLSSTPTPKAQALAKKITKDIKREFTAIFANTPWMDKPTRSAAEAKIRSMDEVLVKPAYLVDEDALDQHYADFYVQDDYLSTSLGAASSATRLFLANFAAGVHVATRDFNPLDLNAFYERELNAMFVSAAIMQPPYLDEGTWTAFNYGGLGSVVGHEVMHGFDERGKNRDARGRLRDWWSPDVLDEYRYRVKCLSQAYAEGGSDVEATEEDVADFASLPAALGAYRYRSYIRERGQTPTFLEFSGEQLFFLNHCFKLCSPDNAYGSRRRRRRRGLYSTDENRCNVPLMHLVEFADAFDCQPHEPMGVPDRCSFWDLPVGQTLIDGDAPHENAGDVSAQRTRT